jgi:hypothetical protein
MAMKRGKKVSETVKSATEEIVKPGKKASAKTVKTKVAAPKATAKPEAKKAAKPEAKAAPAANQYPNSYVVIDHPVDKEIVSGLHYAIRIGASADGRVEISFDDGEWIPCRPAAGYWWFDWGYFTPGTHKLVARLINPEGKVMKVTAPTTCEVV